MRHTSKILLRLVVVMTMALSALAMAGLSASADDGPTQWIDEDGTIHQSTGDDGPSQSVDSDGTIDQETGEGGPCQIIGADGSIIQDTDGDCETPTEEPTEEPTEKPTEEPTEKPTEEPTEKPDDKDKDEDKKDHDKKDHDKDKEDVGGKAEEEVVVEALPSTGQGSGSQDSGTASLMLGIASVFLMAAAGVAWMQRRTA